jgi:hypothetical protein
MHNIWTAYTKGEINSKQAMKMIGEALKTASPIEKRILMMVSDKIIDREVPMTERDADAEEIYSAKINQD